MVQGQRCSAPAGPEKSLLAAWPAFSAGLVFSAAWPMRAEGRFLGSEPAGATQIAPDSGLLPRKRGPKAGPEAAAGREASALLPGGKRATDGKRSFIPPGWS